MFLAVIYVVLWVLLCISAITPDATWPYAGKARVVLELVLLGIIGWVVFHSQIH